MAALMDDEDYELVSKYRWFRRRARCGASYANTRTKSRFAFMHRLILHPAAGLRVHRVNDNGLDNRRANLQICTASQHGATHEKIARKASSSYKGVFWNRSKRRWRVRLKSERVGHWLGSFKDELPAAFAYDDAARQYFGDFARLNLPCRIRRRNLRRWLLATRGRIVSLTLTKSSGGGYRKLTVRVGVNRTTNRGHLRTTRSART